MIDITWIHLLNYAKFAQFNVLPVNLNKVSKLIVKPVGLEHILIEFYKISNVYVLKIVQSNLMTQLVHVIINII